MTDDTRRSVGNRAGQGIDDETVSFPDLLSPAEAAAYLRRSPSWIYMYLNDLPHVRLRGTGKVLLPRKELEEWVRQQIVWPADIGSTSHSPD